MARQPSWCQSIELRGYQPVYGDYMVDIERFTIFMYVRHSLTPSSFIVIPKYIITDKHTLWRSWLGWLHRVLNTYSATDVALAIRLAPTIYHPLYGAEVVEVSTARRLVHCSSMAAAKALQEGVEAPRNRIEEAYLSVTSLTRVPVRPTGSLLLRAVHEGSDLDVVVSELYWTTRFAQAIEDLIRDKVVSPLDRNELLKWARREAGARGLHPRDAAKLYRPWQRFKLGGVTVSAAFTSDEARSRPEYRLFLVGRKQARMAVEVEEGQPGLLDYPSTAYVSRGEGVDILVVYDGIYIPALLGGGRFTVRGVQGFLVLGAERLKAVFIGIREARSTYVLPG